MEQEYLKSLEAQLTMAADPGIARAQEAYMRTRFAFHGVKTVRRRELQKEFLKTENLPPKERLEEIVKNLWEKPEREYQYFAQELLFRYRRELATADISLLEYMITTKSWWDTVDFLAAKLVGAYLQEYPELRREYVEKWLNSGDLWLQRTAVLFQLKYKKETDAALLASTIRCLLGSKEFFINKAIGWALREYSKTDPSWVVDFVENTELSRLSRMEGLRLIKN